MNVRDQIARMCAEVRGEIHGPETLYGMTLLFQEYQRALKLAEHNRNGRNPRFPGKAGREMGDRLQAKADRLAHCFPSFPAALERVNK